MRTISFVFLLFLAFSCSEDKNNNDNLLAENIEYWVEIGDPVTEEYDQNWLEKATRKSFLEDLLAKVKNRELTAYYYMPDTLIQLEDENLDLIFGSTDTSYFENEFGKVEPVAINNELDLDAIVKLKFIEQWFFNKKTNEFTKKVKAICPMVEVYKNEKEILGYKGLFWIYLNH